MENDLKKPTGLSNASIEQYFRTRKC